MDKICCHWTIHYDNCKWVANSSSLWLLCKLNAFFIFTGELLNFLKQRKPSDAFCIVGITMIDLYPKESWNFVFGQASLTKGDFWFSCRGLINLRFKCYCDLKSNFLIFWQLSFCHFSTSIKFEFFCHCRNGSLQLCPIRWSFLWEKLYRTTEEENRVEARRLFCVWELLHSSNHQRSPPPLLQGEMRSLCFFCAFSLTQKKVHKCFLCFVIFS